jgi:UDP-N-acetylmuramyl pentapeptide phosphotransferase/UDP-N-acetylglucosamine-1-phosphate transferase
MGDGGALYVGTLFAFFSLRVMQMQTIDFDYLKITMPHTIAFSIIAVPMIDLVVVFILRLLHGLSPFSADNRHIHHRLINLGLSHGSTTIILILINISIITFAYFIQSTGALRSIIYTLLYCIIMELMIIFINWALIKKKSLIINN